MAMAMRTNKLFILSFSTVFLGIGILSLLPPSSGIELGEHDKWNHFIAYLILALNWCLIKNKHTFFLLGLLLCGCYGLSLEYLQGFVPGRVPSWLDALANTGGVVTGFLIYSITKTKRGQSLVALSYSKIRIIYLIRFLFSSSDFAAIRPDSMAAFNEPFIKASPARNILSIT